MENRGQTIFSKFVREGVVLHGGLMNRSCQGPGSFTNAFFSNLKTENPKMFANHEGIH